MPDLDDRSISQLTSAPDIPDNSLVELATPNNDNGYDSYKGVLSTIFDKILNTFSFTQRLNTNNKTVFGAINEVAQGGGGGGGDSVSWSQVVVSGTKIATITINNVPTDVYAPEGGGTANFVELTQAEYDALEQAGQLQEDVMYFITDGQSGGGVVIDDSTTSASKVWSSQKVETELAEKQDDLSCGQLANVDLDDYKTNGFYWVSQTNVSNKPATNFGYLIVAKPSTVIQIFICFANDSTITRGDMYVRFYANNQWYGWNKIASSRPEPVKAARTGLTIAAGTTSYFTFSGIPVKTGYTRMVTCANPSEGGLYYLRTVENGNDLRIYMNNALGASVTFDLTIMVEYVPT